jgi:hypothetical protein
VLGLIVYGTIYDLIVYGMSIKEALTDVIVGSEGLILVGGIYFPSWLLYVSAALIGNAWRRRRTGRISGTTPASPVSRVTQGAGQQTRKDLTPVQQAMLGWGGTIISAIISLVGTIITVSSGP